MVKTAGCGSAMRGFESHYPPQMRRHSQVVRQRSAKPLFPSSNLGVASIAVIAVEGSTAFFVKRYRAFRQATVLRLSIPDPYRKARMRGHDALW